MGKSSSEARKEKPGRVSVAGVSIRVAQLPQPGGAAAEGARRCRRSQRWSRSRRHETAAQPQEHRSGACAPPSPFVIGTCGTSGIARIDVHRRVCTSCLHDARDEETMISCGLSSIGHQLLAGLAEVE